MAPVFPTGMLNKQGGGDAKKRILGTGFRKPPWLTTPWKLAACSCGVQSDLIHIRHKSLGNGSQVFAIRLNVTQ